MSKKCAITGKGVQMGYSVSHANNKSKKRFLPNLQIVTFLSDALGPIQLRVSTNGLRTVEKFGGIDAYLQKVANRRLTDKTKLLKKRLTKNLEKTGGQKKQTKSAS